ncbi:MAG TPA: carboxypeptidase-like regulatory domain-containing protein [Chitinophagaceae bacterium]
MRLILFMLPAFLFVTGKNCFAQSPTLRGTVSDDASKGPAAFASVKLSGAGVIKTTITDSAGNFVLTNVPVGRYEIEVSLVGFQTAIVKEIVVTAGKETFVAVLLEDKNSTLSEVRLRPRTNKSRPINMMAVASARMFSVEEANRYAGGFDDYARLAASFPGVASNVGNNGIIIRGNSPRLLQWKMEGVEIPNPNHFADLASFGAGGLTGLSSQLLDNSDFLTGAFPAEYSNTLAGVFDMNMRKGNHEKKETTLQLGLLGIDVATEGPFKKEKQSSYLFNYRYSTLGLLKSIMPDDAGGTTYQDLSFKLNFPTKRSGVFSVWGIGLIDKSGAEAEKDQTKWEYLQDKEKQDVSQYMGALGISHRYFFNKRTHIKTTLAGTINGIDMVTDRMNNQHELLPQNIIKNKTGNLVLSSYVNTKFNKRHTNKTGITATALFYDLLLKEAKPEGSPLETIVAENGSSWLLNAYSHSSFRLSQRFTLNAGISSQLFTLNNRKTIEPRLGLKYQAAGGHSLSFAYGLHSRLERLNYYFTKSTTNEFHNKDLDFTKAHHFVVAYDWTVSNNMHIRIEPYYQQLFDVPVIPDSSYSFINMENDWFLNNKLSNTGKGRNIGIDISVEKYLTDGFYYLVSASVFDSKYKGGDNKWRNTRFNRNFLFNVLGGKEWQTGRQGKNTLGLNLRISYQGGDHYIPVNEAASIAEQDVVYDGTKAFEKSIDPLLLTHLTFSYKKNKARSSRQWSLKLINATGQKEFNGFRYNFAKQRVDMNREALIVPNLSYKIEF